MMIEDKELAALYRLPLTEFTTARNGLAKKRGTAGADIRTLEKPHAAAWAVNQLFWLRPKSYDAVIAAAQLMRDAHSRMLAGRQADVPRAETAHRDAIKAAVAEIRELAGAGGENLSAATLDAVSETLQALPSSETAGQLTRPLKPLGFAALMTLSGVQESRGPGVQKAKKAAAKKEAADRAARRKALQKAVRAAQARESDAENALAASRKVLAKVERDHAAARDRLQFLDKQRDDAEQETRERAKALREATNLRTQAEQDLNTTA